MALRYDPDSVEDEFWKVRFIKKPGYRVYKVDGHLKYYPKNNRVFLGPSRYERENAEEYYRTPRPPRRNRRTANDPGAGQHPQPTQDQLNLGINLLNHLDLNH